MTMQNSALGRVTPKSVSGPDRFHRIIANEPTDTTASTAPNSSVAPEVLFGVFGCPWTPAVKMSTSSWMRWSGLSIGSPMNRPR
jgi:hypothetical protein